VGPNIWVKKKNWGRSKTYDRPSTVQSMEQTHGKTLETFWINPVWEHGYPHPWCWEEWTRQKVSLRTPGNGTHFKKAEVKAFFPGHDVRQKKILEGGGKAPMIQQEHARIEGETYSDTTWCLHQHKRVKRRNFRKGRQVDGSRGFTGGKNNLTPEQIDHRSQGIKNKGPCPPELNLRAGKRGGRIGGRLTQW